MEKREKEIVTETIGPIRKIAKAFRPRRGWLSCTHQISLFLSFTQMNIIHNRFHIYRNQTETFSMPTLQAAYNLSILRTSRDRVDMSQAPTMCLPARESGDQPCVISLGSSQSGARGRRAKQCYPWGSFPVLSPSSPDPPSVPTST